MADTVSMADECVGAVVVLVCELVAFLFELVEECVELCIVWPDLDVG